MRIYLFELYYQGEYLRLANRNLDEADGLHEAWLAIHSILASAGNISKLLWGGGDADRQDRKPLRELLGVKDDSPLKIRHVRNKFEHIDEYIDEWLDEDPTRPFVGRNIGGSPDQWPEGKHLFGHYDPDSGRVWFWDWEISVPEMVQEAHSIAGQAWAHALAARWVD